MHWKFQSSFLHSIFIFLNKARKLLPIDVDVNVIFKGYHITYYYQKYKNYVAERTLKKIKWKISKFQYCSNGITLFKGITTLNGKTWLDGTVFSGQKIYQKKENAFLYPKI